MKYNDKNNLAIPDPCLLATSLLVGGISDLVRKSNSMYIAIISITGYKFNETLAQYKYDI